MTKDHRLPAQNADSPAQRAIKLLRATVRERDEYRDLLEDALAQLSEEDRQVVAAHLEREPNLAPTLYEVLSDAEFPGNCEGWRVIADASDEADELSIEAWLDESLSARVQEIPGVSPADISVVAKIYPPAGGGLVQGVLEVKFLPRTVPGSYLWDSTSLAFHGHILALAGCLSEALMPGDRASAIAFALDNPPAPYIPHPLFRFHPERYRQSRSYTRAARSILSASRLPTLDELTRLIQLVTDAFNDRLPHLPRRPGIAPATVIMEAEQQQLLAWLKFMAAGKQIFEVPAHMADLFRRTDVDDVPVKLIQLPYPVLYLHFGPQDDLLLKPGWRIDGCYVEFHAKHSLLAFTFTARPLHEEDVERWVVEAEPVLHLALTREGFDYELGTAVDLAVADKLNTLTQEATNSPVAAAGMLPEGIRDVSSARAIGQLHTLEAQRPVLGPALKLAVNALCYLTAYPDDVEEQWPTDGPTELFQRADVGAPNQRKRAEQELARLGYSRIKICGRRLALHPEVLTHEGPLDVAYSVRAHWRRGHWRRQAYGPARQSRKLIWLMPMLINAPAPAESGGGASEVPGHIYGLEPDGSGASS